MAFDNTVLEYIAAVSKLRFEECVPMTLCTCIYF